MRCDFCMWNTCCLREGYDVDNDGPCGYFDDIEGDSRYLPTWEQFQHEFYIYMEGFYSD